MLLVWSAYSLNYCVFLKESGSRKENQLPEKDSKYLSNQKHKTVNNYWEFLPGMKMTRQKKKHKPFQILKGSHVEHQFGILYVFQWGVNNNLVY